MKRVFYIIPAIYFILAGFFIFMHYSQRISFSRAIGNIELTGQATKGTPVRPSEIRKLNMFVNGMSFQFNSSRSLKVRTEDGILHKAVLTDYRAEENSFSLFFDDNIKVIFSTDSADNKITVSAELPETVPPIRSLILPFREDRGFALGYTEEDNTPVISNGETRYFLAMTNKYEMDAKAGQIAIDVTDNNPINLVIQETLVSKGRTAEKWYEQNTVDLAGEYRDAVSTFVNNAFFGWNSRFNSKTGMWTDAEGNQEFREVTAVSYLSESLVRGSYPTASNLIKTATVPIDQELTAWTAPYVGNIVVKGDELISRQRQEKADVTGLINSADLKIFKIDRLDDFMKSNGLDRRIGEVINLALKVKEEPLDTTIDRLRFINDIYGEYSGYDFESFITNTVEKYILPSVSWLDEGLFLIGEDRISVETSFRAGRELLSTGNLLGNSFYQAVGREMITSILSKAGDSAFLPAELTTDENKILSQSGSVLPEDFYYDLTENPYYSTQYPLTESLGEGSWILTSAQHFNVQRSPRETVISVSFPKGSIHYFAIKGVKPFVRIYMHGFKWPSDANFQRYSDGWVYDKTTETLYVKLKHRVESETLQILYYNPDQEAASTAPVQEPGDTVAAENPGS